jgi:Tfp pilus assembly protein PilO
MKLSRREKLISVLTLTVVTLWLFNAFLYTPKKKEIVRVKEELKSIDETMNQAIVLRAEKERLERELQVMRERVRAYQGKLSGEQNFSTFLKGLAAETSRLNIKTLSLVPKEKTGGPNAPLKRYAIELKLTGSYEAFTLFLDRLKEMPILTMVDQFQIEKGEKGEGILKVNLILKTYFLRGGKV